MSSLELFYTANEVASMFRLTPNALNSRRKRGMAPGSLAVKVGGRYLYPKPLIDNYVAKLTASAQEEWEVDGSVADGGFGDAEDGSSDPDIH